MAQKMLAVCHSTGDSKLIIASSRMLAKKQVNTTILSVGAAAKKQVDEALTAADSQIYHVNIDYMLPQQPIANNISSLTSEQLEQLDKQLNINSFSGLLIGTHSYSNPLNQCQIQRQLLERYRDLPSTVVSDYAFYEPEHTLSTERWFTRAKQFLVPFKKAIGAFNASPDTTFVVGHPEIDAVKNKFKSWANYSRKTLRNGKVIDPIVTSKRIKMKIRAKQRLIFVASGKSDDEAMVEALAIMCKRFPQVVIRLGAHPAATPAYLEQLQQIINHQGVSRQMRFLSKDITTDEAVYAADGVCTISSTVGTVAAACGKTVAFYHPPTEPYIVDDCPWAKVYQNQNSLLNYFNQCRENSTPQIPVTFLETNQSAAEKISTHVRKIMNPM